MVCASTKRKGTNNKAIEIYNFVQYILGEGKTMFSFDLIYTSMIRIEFYPMLYVLDKKENIPCFVLRIQWI